MSGTVKIEHPKVFVSYSWTSDPHVEWVIELAKRLRENGVDVVLDKWELKEGNDLHDFMERMVKDPGISKVLIVCDKMYTEKANNRKGGVGKETLIISKEVYEGVQQDKFIPIARELDERGEPYLPIYLNSRVYLRMATDDEYTKNYDQLLRSIFNRPLHKKPPLGTPPDYILSNEPPHLLTAIAQHAIEQSLANSDRNLNLQIKEYFAQFLAIFDKLRIGPEAIDEKKEPFDETMYKKVESFTPQRDDFVNFLEKVVNVADHEYLGDELHAFLEKVIPYTQPHVSQSSWNELWFDHYYYILYEFFLHIIAVLIKNRAYDLAMRLMDEDYVYTERLGGENLVHTSLVAFNQSARVFDEMRNKRVFDGRRLSVTADLIKERATHPSVRFVDLLQVDIILFLRSEHAKQDFWRGWYPRTLVLGRGKSLDLFVRAENGRGAEILSKLLGIPTLKELFSVLQKQNVREVISSQRLWDVHFDGLLNLPRLRESVEPPKQA